MEVVFTAEGGKGPKGKPKSKPSGGKQTSKHDKHKKQSRDRPQAEEKKPRVPKDGKGC